MEDNTTSSADYFLSPTADSGGTHCFGIVFLSPAAVVRRFGQSGKSDEYKVSQEWTFCKGDLVFTLYDWKSTDLYDPELYPPEGLWTCEEPLDLHIGSKEPATPQDVQKFANWLEHQVQRA
jgi:hypothetical protein